MRSNNNVGGIERMRNMIASVFSLGANHASWYAWMFLGFAVLIIFPDEASDNIGWTFDWRHLIWLEAILISIVIVAMIILKRFYPDLQWYLPLIAIGFVALIRGIVWFINRSVDNDL
jgi:hypothetical protein